MLSLVTNLNRSTPQEIVNWVTTADECVHTADVPQLDSRVLTARVRTQLNMLGLYLAILAFMSETSRNTSSTV